MAVETPKWLTGALAWRWTPTLALLFGSLLYVGVAVVVVPSEIDFSGGGRSSSTSSFRATSVEDRSPSPVRAAMPDAPPPTPDQAVTPPEPAPDPEAAALETPARRSRRRRVIDPVVPTDTPPAEAAPAPTTEPPAGEIVRPFDPNAAPPP